MAFKEILRRTGIWFVIVLLGAIVVAAVGTEVWAAILHGLGEKRKTVLVLILFLGFFGSMGAVFLAFRWKDRLN